MLKWQWNPLEDKLEGIIQINSQAKTKQNNPPPPKKQQHNSGVLRSKGTFEPLCLSTKGANNAQLGRQA